MQTLATYIAGLSLAVAVATQVSEQVSIQLTRVGTAIINAGIYP